MKLGSNNSPGNEINRAIRDNELSWPYIFFLLIRNGYGNSTLRVFVLGFFEESGSDFQGFHLLVQNRQLSFFFS